MFLNKVLLKTINISIYENLKTKRNTQIQTRTNY